MWQLQRLTLIEMILCTVGITTYLVYFFVTYDTFSGVSVQQTWRTGCYPPNLTGIMRFPRTTTVNGVQVEVYGSITMKQAVTLDSCRQIMQSVPGTYTTPSFTCNKYGTMELQTPKSLTTTSIWYKIIYPNLKCSEVTNPVLIVTANGQTSQMNAEAQVTINGVTTTFPVITNGDCNRIFQSMVPFFCPVYLSRLDVVSLIFSTCMAIMGVSKLIVRISSNWVADDVIYPQPVYERVPDQPEGPDHPERTSTTAQDRSFTGSTLDKNHKS